MPGEETIDQKLITLPKVVLQNLKLEPPPEDAPLSDLCRLPKVHLENLRLEAAPVPKAIKFTSMKVNLENLNLTLTENSRRSNESPRLPKDENRLNGFSKIPFIALSRCDASKLTKTKTIPKFTCKYTIVGQYKNVPIRPCTVAVRRDNLHKLKSSLGSRKPQPCKLCGKIYFSKKKLSYHQERKHDLVPPTVMLPVQKKKRVSFSNQVIVHTMPYHRCRKCLKIFESYKVLKSHMRSLHRKRDQYVCDYCDKLFADRTIFKIHIKLHCDVCHQVFNEKKYLLQHKKTVCRKVRKTKCKTCDEIFYSNLALKDHSYSHLEDKKLICDICKEHCNTYCSLIRHLHTHDKQNGRKLPQYTVAKRGAESIYTCRICAETFANKFAINRHINGEIPVKTKLFNCTYCPKSFSLAQNQLQHTWTHISGRLTEKTNEARQNGMSNHKTKDGAGETQAVVSSEKPRVKITNGSLQDTAKNNRAREDKLYFCPICNRSFKRSNSVRRHQSVHMRCAAPPAAPSPLRCERCEETFAWPALLRAHTCLRGRHIEEVPLLPSEFPVPTLSAFSLEDLPVTQDVMTHIDFELPSPQFEFAAVATGPEVLISPGERGLRYRLVRQEVPIEF